MCSHASTSRILLVLSLVLLTAAFAVAGTAANYFTVVPAVAAPGQFVQFSWNATGAKGFVVTPSLLGEDQTALPLSAVNYAQIAPAVTTGYQAMAVGAQQGAPMTANLTIVPVTIAASAAVVAAGQPVKLSFTGPNNGSSFFLVTLPENSVTPLVADSCSGNTCTGSYVTPALGSDRIFMIEADGPYGGQSYSQPLTVKVHRRNVAVLCRYAGRSGIRTAGHDFLERNQRSSVRIDQGVGEVSPTGSWHGLRFAH